MKKYSCSKKPLTVAAVAAIEGTKFSYSRRTQVLKRATELCGIVPFDWHKTEIYDGDRLPLPPGKGFVMYFGFDTTSARNADQEYRGWCSHDAGRSRKTYISELYGKTHRKIQYEALEK